MGKAVYVTNLSLSGIFLFHKAPWPAISCQGTSPKREAVAICNSVTLQTLKTTVRTLTPLTLKTALIIVSHATFMINTRSVHVERQPRTVAL